MPRICGRNHHLTQIYKHAFILGCTKFHASCFAEMCVRCTETSPWRSTAQDQLLPRTPACSSRSTTAMHVAQPPSRPPSSLIHGIPCLFQFFCVFLPPPLSPWGRHCRWGCLFRVTSPSFSSSGCPFRFVCPSASCTGQWQWLKAFVCLHLWCHLWASLPLRCIKLAAWDWCGREREGRILW